MNTTELGLTGIRINRVGFGAMHLARRTDITDEQARDVLKEIMSRGGDFIDTADVYCPQDDQIHRGEKQIFQALEQQLMPVCIATKGGLISYRGTCIRYGDPNFILSSISESHKCLGGKSPITLWQYHQHDKNFPLKTSLSAVKEAVSRGLVKHVGVSNFSLENLKRARDVIEIVSIQNEYNLWVREPESNGLLDYCEREGITVIAWRPMGGWNRVKTLNGIGELHDIARGHRRSVVQIVLAWLLSRSPRILAIPGTTSPDHFSECFESRNFSLSPEEITCLSGAITPEASQISD
jgi:aryl-alcohol dehydrogenase-like predicted oxidoreductase